jgi:hypothetical protein
LTYVETYLRSKSLRRDLPKHFFCCVGTKLEKFLEDFILPSRDSTVVRDFSSQILFVNQLHLGPWFRN